MNRRIAALLGAVTGLVVLGSPFAFAQTGSGAPAVHQRTATAATMNSSGMSPNSAVGPRAAASATNEKAAFSYFVGKGLSQVQSAGVVGNLIQESGVSPTAVQQGGLGRGIAQWSVGGRWDTSSKDNMKWFAAAHQTAMMELSPQLDFTWYELSTFSSYGLSQLKSASSIDGAVSAFESRFEGCGQCEHANRVADAQRVYNSYATASTAFAVSPSSPYSNIKALQHLLNAYGITTATDGSYGPATTTSVKTFQKQHNLSQTGNADTTTMTAMTGGANVAVKAGWPNPDTVDAVQQLLIKFGYKAVVNGTYDSTDTTMIKTFQTSHKLTATGTVDATTWKRLFVPTSS